MTSAWITDASVLLARELWDEGVTATDIGRRLGVTKSAVVGLAHRRGWPRRPSPIPVNGVFETGTLVRKPRPRRTPVAPLPSLEAPPAPVEAPAPVAPFPPLCRACQWPLGDPRRRASFRYCGAEVSEPGRVYCGPHLAIAYYHVVTSRRVAA